MTEQIKNAIDHYRDVCVQMGQYPESDTYRYAELAIRSLKAWEEVLNELEEFDENEYLKDEGHRFGCNEGICYALELINQKLAEIEGG